MGIDKIFNLEEVFLTAFYYKQLSVTNSVNCDHPIILGPVFLNGASTFEYFSQFMAYVSIALQDSLTHNLVICSDDKALRKAVQFFPLKIPMCCALNTYAKTQQTIFKTQSALIRRNILKSARRSLGKEGLLSAGVEPLLLFDKRAEQLAIEFDIKLRAFSK